MIRNRYFSFLPLLTLLSNHSGWLLSSYAAAAAVDMDNIQLLHSINQRDDALSGSVFHRFGRVVSLSGDGTYLAVGDGSEQSDHAARVFKRTKGNRYLQLGGDIIREPYEIQDVAISGGFDCLCVTFSSIPSGA